MPLSTSSHWAVPRWEGDYHGSASRCIGRRRGRPGQHPSRPPTTALDLSPVLVQLRALPTTTTTTKESTMNLEGTGEAERILEKTVFAYLKLEAGPGTVAW